MQANDVEEFRQRERIENSPPKKYRLKLTREVECPQMRWHVNKGVLPATIQKLESLVTGKNRDLILLKCVDILGMGVTIGVYDLLDLSIALVMDKSKIIPFSLMNSGFLQKIGYRLPVFGLLEFVCDQNLPTKLVWDKIVAADEMIRGSPEQILQAVF